MHQPPHFPWYKLFYGFHQGDRPSLVKYRKVKFTPLWEFTLFQAFQNVKFPMELVYGSFYSPFRVRTWLDASQPQADCLPPKHIGADGVIEQEFLNTRRKRMIN
jgi:hypothetical protein